MKINQIKSNQIKSNHITSHHITSHPLTHPPRTKDVYSRVLKHGGAKVHRRVHPSLTETLAEARMVSLASSAAIELFQGSNSGGGGGGGYEGNVGDASGEVCGYTGCLSTESYRTTPIGPIGPNAAVLPL